MALRLTFIIPCYMISISFMAGDIFMGYESDNKAEKKQTLSVYRMVVCALFAVIICVLSPLSIPIGAVPVSLGLFAVLLAAVATGPVDSTVAVIIYLLLGMIGLPVFAGGRSGIAVLAGPTGGYLWSYPLTTLLTGWLCSIIKRSARGRFLRLILCFCSCIAGVIVCYLCGTLFYSAYAGISFVQALLVCVVPFIVFDIIKCILASFAGLELHRLIKTIHKS